MKSRPVVLLGVGLLALSSVVLMWISFARDDPTNAVVGSSMLMMAASSMMLLSGSDAGDS